MVRFNFQSIKVFLNSVALCVVAVIAYQNQSEFFRLFNQVRVKHILLFLVLNFISTLLATLRWRQLFPKNLSVKYSTLLLSFLASHPFKLIGLGFIGSDIYKSVDITTTVSLKKSESMLLTFIDRLISLFSLTFLGFIFSSYYLISSELFSKFYKFSMGGCFIIILALCGSYIFVKYLKLESLPLLGKRIDFNFIRSIPILAFSKAIVIGLINHTVSIFSFFILISGFLPSTFDFFHFFPFGVSLFVTEALPIFGAAHFSSTLFFNSVGVKNGLFLFNDYYLCLKFFQVLLSFTLIPALFKKRSN